MKLFSRVIALGYLLIPALVMAAEEGHGEHAHVPSVSDLTYPIINFLIYFVILVVVFKKYVPSGLKTRAASVEKAVNAGLSALKAAEKELANARLVLTTFEEQAETIKQQIAKDAENEAALIGSQAEAKSKAVVAQAHSTAAAEHRAMESSLRDELAEMIVRLAEERIKRDLTPESDRALRERAVQNVSVLRG